LLERMRVRKKLALIAAGYGFAVVGGIAAGAVNELFIPEDIQETSGGMVAFGDMVVFMLGTGVLSLLPTWFLLKLWVEKNPRTLLAVELLIAALGPLSWLAVSAMAAGPAPERLPQVFGLLIAFGAIPRIVLGPIVLVIEALTFLLIRARLARALPIVAMLMDLIPLCMFVLHMVAASYRY
jgi:hypothetical protein